VEKLIKISYKGDIDVAVDRQRSPLFGAFWGSLWGHHATAEIE